MNVNLYTLFMFQVGRGILVSMGQVYAINDVTASSVMNLAVFLASPLLFFIVSEI